VGVGKQIVMAVGGGLFCIALVSAAILMRSGDSAEESKENKNPASKAPGKKPLAPINLALGNVVTVVAELGLSVKNTKDVKVETSRLAAKIENQLAALREFYRDISETRPALMGGMMLELTVGPAGDITQVKELSTRIADSEFRKAVLAAVNKWEFKDVVPEGATILCPLLFVREGMDITTLVKWEKNLGAFEEKASLGRPAAAPVPNAAIGPAPVAVPIPNNPQVEGKAEIPSENANSLAQVGATP